MIKKILSYVFLILFYLPILLFAQTSPEEFLGHKVGADRKLADYKQITAYFENLDKESEKIKILTIGKSTLNKPMIMAVITSEQNMTKLDKYQNMAKILRNARGLVPEEAKKLAKESKIILLITCNLHSTEIGSSQMAMELAYKLITGDTPFNAHKVLNEVIILLAPTINPDGQQMVTDWYRKYVGTKYEGGRMPWLYHHYAGHDNNRDWFMLNLAETKAITRILYKEWIPQIHIDEHQSGITSPRLFLPPFADPPNPNVHPLLWRGVDICGMSMAYDLQKNDFQGVVHGREYIGWWDGACDNTGWLHNTICLLSEMASAKIASPIYIDPTERPKTNIEKRMQLPDPWPGGWWRLRDIVDYELTFTFSLIKTAYLYRENFIYSFYKMCRDSIKKTEDRQPFAFVIPKTQHDYPTMLCMLDKLISGGVEIHKATEDFMAGGKVYPAGSFVVKMSQPYQPYAQALLEKQEYPDIRQYPEGPPEPPYDNAGLTLPLQMGVEYERIEKSFEANLEKVEKVIYPNKKDPSDSALYIILDCRENASYSVAFSLLKEGAELYRSKEVVEGDEFKAAPGSFIVKNTEKLQNILPGLLDKWHATAYELEDVSDVPKSPLKKYRVGLYQSWQSNMDEGWTRYVFDHKGVTYTTLHNKDFKKKQNPADLIKDYDAIVFASEDANIIKTGKPDPKSRWSRHYTEMPPEYRGGIGKEGVEALKIFVEQGGILVTLNNACDLIFDEFNVPAENLLDRNYEDKFFCPGSILRIEVDNTAPIGYGMPKKASAMFSRQSLALRTTIPSGEWNRQVVANYPKKNILLSGWLLGEDIIARRASVVDAKYKKGHIILIGFPCQSRAQSHGTYKFLFNALLYPEVN